MGLSSAELREIKSTIISLFNDKFLQDVASKVAGMVEKQFEEQLKIHLQKIKEVRDKTMRLENENKHLRKLFDEQEQLMRNSNVRIFGMAVKDGENLHNEVSDLFINKLNVNMVKSDIKRCHRIANKKPSDKPPAVLVQLGSEQVRVSILKNRTKLKNSGVQIREDLTKMRLDLFGQEVHKFSYKNSWVFNGSIYVKVNNVVHRISDENNLRDYLVQEYILPRKQFMNSHRWLSFSAERGRGIIVWLALADLLAAVGVFVRSTTWISQKNIMPAGDDDASVLFCAISSAFIQYFYTATWIWTLCYAIDMRYVLRQEEGHTKYYHLVAWLIPAVLTTTGLSVLYLPDANCHASTSLSTALYRILPNYVVTYTPMVAVMVTNPILYRHSIEDMKNIITCTSGQFTSRERDILEAIKIKFSVINLIFYLCWVPNLVNGVLLWTLWFHLPEGCVIFVWYVMAFTNPLQAFFNSLVYRRWSVGSEKVVLPWRHYENSNFHISIRSSSSDSSTGTIREEIYPLLQSTPSKSVNEYKSLG